MKPQWPTAPKTQRVLNHLRNGSRLTVRHALLVIDVYALSQEVGRLRRLGWKIKDEMIKTSEGVHCKAYWL